MSSEDIIISFYSGFRTERYVYFASVAMLLYDFTLTFDREVNLFWSKKFTGASALYFLIRYLTMAYEILDVVSSVFTMSAQSCNGLLRTYASIEYARFIPFAAFSAMRAHALIKNYFLSVSILVLSLMPLVNLAVLFPLGLTGLFDPAVGCEADIVRITPVIVIAFVSVSRSGLILADLTLVVITWSLTAVMLWNGLMYFMVLFILNVLHLSFTLTSMFGAKEPSKITLFTDPITSILTWRFLLDLQAANQRDLKLDSDDPLHISMPHRDEGSLSFARVMGSIESIVLPPGADEIEIEDAPGSYELSHVLTREGEAIPTQEPELELDMQGGGSEFYQNTA